MKQLTLLIFIIGILSCSNPKKSSNLAIQTSGIESIPLDSILLNYQFTFTNTKEKLLYYLGKPDSIVSLEDDYSFYNENGVDCKKIAQQYFYNNSIFIVYENIAELSKIDFKSGKYSLITPRIILSRNTTIYDIKKTFPKAYNGIWENINEKDHVKYKCLIIGTSISSDDGWFLTFYNDKLVDIQYIPSFA